MTINFTDTTFYNKESKNYSGKRYNTAANTYVQFFFQERLRHVISLVEAYSKKDTQQILIEDGCADGIVADTIYTKFKERFSRVYGTDISPEMIKAAEEMNTHTAISYFEKNEFDTNIKADIVLAVGFVSPGIFDDEFAFINEHLAKDGIVIMSLVNRNSTHAKLKLKGKEILNDYWSFTKYEEFLSKNFEILEKIPYGFFVPKLWSVPLLARILQPVCEVLGKISPNLAHESLYVLKKR